MKAENFLFHGPEMKGTLFWFWAGSDDYSKALELVDEAAKKIGEYRSALTNVAKG